MGLSYRAVVSIKTKFAKISKLAEGVTKRSQSQAVREAPFGDWKFGLGSAFPRAQINRPFTVT
jgi:hypothetical protein